MKRSKQRSPGAEAFAIQIDQLEQKYHTEAVYRTIFDAMEGKPVYVTYYRGNRNGNRTDEELEERLYKLAASGATLCDVTSDLFCPHPDQVTADEAAIMRQIYLIDNLHKMGGRGADARSFLQIRYT